MINTGSAASIVYQQGAMYANGEFIQIHPTAIPGDDKLRLMSESARGEGGRIWTYKDGKPWYFLEEKYLHWYFTWIVSSEFFINLNNTTEFNI